MQYVLPTQDKAGARPAMPEDRVGILRPVALILAAAAGTGVWWIAELGRFWA
jgi:hypothetical protein